MEVVLATTAITEQLSPAHAVESHSWPTTTTATPAYQCQVCFEYCDTLDILDEHNRAEHADVPNVPFKFKCEICQRRYKSVALLRCHMRRHIDRKFHCMICPRAYINRSELEAHKLAHSGLMPHACDMCAKKFRYAHHLKRHKDVAHYDVRYRCTMPNCGRQYTTQAQLKVHIQTHSGNIPYKCPHTVCGREFKKRETLRQHALRFHKIKLTEEEIAAIFLDRVGYTNPHDFTVAVSDGKMLRREKIYTMATTQHAPPPSPDESMDETIIY